MGKTQAWNKIGNLLAVRAKGELNILGDRVHKFKYYHYDQSALFQTLGHIDLIT